MVMTMLVMMRVALYQRLIYNMDLQHIITLLSKRTSREMNIIAEYITIYES